MRLGYFTMPVHPMNRDWSQTLREDREAIILADKLGFHDAFVGEHLTDACENITNSTLFLATLIHSTENIKLASGTWLSSRKRAISGLVIVTRFFQCENTTASGLRALSFPCPRCALIL